tara:strand:+ start:207 stop:1517 length:1311 start_codon:yes stop_codon:yes gene_type:complete
LITIKLAKWLNEKIFYGWSIVLAAGLLTFFGTGFFSYTRGFFLPELAETLDNGNRFFISLGFSLATMTGALISPAIGRYLDRGSPKKVIFLGIVINGFFYLVLSQASSLLAFYMAVSIGLGVGMICMGGFTHHRAILNWFDHWRGRAVSVAVLGASLAGVAMPAIVEGLITNYGWQATYQIFALVLLLGLSPVVWLLFIDRPEQIKEVRDGRHYANTNSQPKRLLERDNKVWSFGELIKTPAFWSIGLIFGTMLSIWSAVMLHLVGHLRDIGLEIVWYIISAQAAFAALGKPVVGIASDFLGARITIWSALSLQVLALLLFGAASEENVLILAACIYGLGYSGMSPLRTFAISTSLGSRSFGTASGAIRYVELPFQMLAAPAAALIYDHTGSYQLAFSLLAGMALIACLGPFFISVGGARERKDKNLNEIDHTKIS